MFSIFSPKYSSSDAITISSLPKAKDSSVRMYNLPNRKILIHSSDISHKSDISGKYESKTTLKIYTSNLKNCQEEKVVDDLLDLKCIFPDGSMLFRKYKFNSKQYPIQLVHLSNRLELIFSTMLSGSHLSDSIVAINNKSFFLITQNQEKYSVSIYKWNENSYEKIKSHEINSYLKPESLSPSYIQVLGKIVFVVISVVMIKTHNTIV